MITKSQYVDWENSAVTQAMYEEVKEVVEELGNRLIYRKSPDLHEDAYLRGYIMGVQAGRMWKPDFSVEEEDGQS